MFIYERSSTQLQQFTYTKCCCLYVCTFDYIYELSCRVSEVSKTDREEMVYKGEAQ